MCESDDPLHFGEWLKRRRRTLDLTQAELADLAGCSVFTVRKIESGERRPSKQLAELLAQVLDIPADQREIFIKVARGERNLARLPLSSIGAVDKSDAIPLPKYTPLYNLPLNLTPFIGRRPELEAIGRLLSDPLCRLLTLIGAGGIGKTRLAIQAADQEQQQFSGGICFVPLASISSSAFLVQAIADALDFSFQGQSEPRDQLLDHLVERRILLVLDNFEHLLDGVALLTKILQHAPGVKLLVTSRERLNLQSEWVYTIEGLRVPPRGEVDDLETYTAVELFINSARRSRADFSVQDKDLLLIARICQLVEGIPLSIELAAAWISLLNCSEIVQEIERGFDFLASSALDLPDRQRSQRAVFEHSWNLLSDKEQDALSKLALFKGGFDRQAALEVTDAPLPTLLALVAKSLVRRTAHGRFDLHEVIRQYALAHLEEGPNCDTTCDRHSHYYLSHLRDQRMAIHGPAQRDVIQELKDEIDNLRIAWKWAVDRGNFSLLGETMRSFGWLCNVGVMYTEGINQIDLVIQALRAGQEKYEEQQQVLGAALAQQGLLFFRQGKFDLALRALDESLTLTKPLGDPELLTDPLVLSGIMMHLIGEMDRSLDYLREGLAQAQEAKDQFYTAYALYNLGYVDSLLGEYHLGYKKMLVGLDLWRQLGDPSSIALGLNYISPIAIHLGHLQEAQDYLEESLSLLIEIGDRWGMGTAYRFLGLTALARGEPVEAQSLLRKSLAMFEGIITGWDVAQSLIYLGEATASAGELAEARAMFYEAFHIAQEFQVTPLILESLVGLAQLQEAAGQAEAALEISTIVVQHQSATYETKKRAQSIIAATENVLSAEQVAASQERAEKTPLNSITQTLLFK